MAEETQKLEKEILREIADMLVTEITANLTRPMPWEAERRPDPGDTLISDTGSLLRSIRVEENADGFVVVIDMPYADVIEFGAPPHSVPIEPLIRWAKRKLKKSDKGAENFAWAVKNTIARFGQNPHPYVRPAVEVIKQKLEA